MGAVCAEKSWIYYFLAEGAIPDNDVQIADKSVFIKDDFGHFAPKALY